MPDLTDPVTLETNAASANLVSGRTDIGLKRTTNQDRWSAFDSPWGKCLVLADGMGGHLGGERAAELVTERFAAYFNGTTPETNLGDALRASIERANRDVYEEGHGEKTDVHGMGSTVVVALLGNQDLVVAHCGDSRAYIYRAGRLTRLTEDHTVGNRMLRAGILSPEQAFRHPDAGLLTRSIGAEPNIEPAVSDPTGLEAGDIIMLCSDGLSAHVAEADIERTLATSVAPEKLSGNLIHLALEKGSSDNVTVIVARHGSPARFNGIAVLRNRMRVPRVRGKKQWLGAAFAVVALAIIGFGIKFDVTGRGKTNSLPPVSGQSQGRPLTPVAPVPAVSTGESARAARTVNKIAEKAEKTPAKDLAAPKVVVQLLVEKPSQLPAGIAVWAAPLIKSKNYYYLGNINPPGKPHTETFRLLDEKALNPITIFHNDQLCSTEQVDLIAKQLQDATHLTPQRIPFVPTPEQVGVLASRLANVGILVVLKAVPGTSGR